MHYTYTFEIVDRERDREIEETDLLLGEMSCKQSIDITVFGFVTRAYTSNVID